MAPAPRRTISRRMVRTGGIIGFGAAALLTGLTLIPTEARAQERRFFQVTPGPRSEPPRLDTSLGAGGRPQGVTVMDSSAIARWLCPNGGRPTRGRPGRCDGRGVARGGTGGGGSGAESDVAGWHADLAPPSHRQIACPSGTVAAQARFNPGTVRCMPEQLREATARAPVPPAEAQAPQAMPAPASTPPAPAAPAQPVPASPLPAVAALPATPAAPAPLAALPNIAAPAASPVPSALSRMVAEGSGASAQRLRNGRSDPDRRPAPSDGS